MFRQLLRGLAIDILKRLEEGTRDAVRVKPIAWTQIASLNDGDSLDAWEAKLPKNFRAIIQSDRRVDPEQLEAYEKAKADAMKLADEGKPAKVDEQEFRFFEVFDVTIHLGDDETAFEIYTNFTTLRHAQDFVQKNWA